MAVYIRGNIYWVRFEHRGQRIARSTEIHVDTPNGFRLAKDREVLFKAEAIAKQGPGGKGATSQISLGDLAELDMQRAEKRGLAKGRVKTLAYMWRKLYQHLGGQHRWVETLELADVSNYEAARRAAGAAGQTIVRERQALIRGLYLAVNSGLMERLPFPVDNLENVRRTPKHAQRKGVLHTEAHINLVFSNLSAKAVTAGHREMLRFVMLTGLRASELERVAKFQVTKTAWGALLHVQSAKTVTAFTEVREVPLNLEALTILEEWRHRFAVADLTHSLYRASKKAGLARGVTLRDLRKWYISNVARHDLAAAQRLAGHTSVATTALYVDALQDRLVRAALTVGTVPWVQPKEGETKTAIESMRDAGVEPAAFGSGGKSSTDN